MSTKASGDPFGHQGQAEDYAIFRPNYPDELIHPLLDTFKAKGLLESGDSTIVDVCTGNGQILRKLATHFGSAKGYDRSVAQLSQVSR